MNVDPDGEMPQILMGALAGAMINLIFYTSDLIAKHGIKKFYKKFKISSAATTMLRGAVSGAIGIGLVSKLKKIGELSNIATAFLSGHLAPAAYLVGNVGNLSRSGFTENQILSAFGTKSNAIWSAVKPHVTKIYNKYKFKKKVKKRKKWWF
ncbi:hypothetical protein MHB75_00830 [Kurthia sp. FSL E2-0154]|uniref:hypothetical protein n=2 Tax=Kurthia sp. FSL E2-0154 TaxID=2921358 RepID=UPI0030FC2729